MEAVEKLIKELKRIDNGRLKVEVTYQDEEGKYVSNLKVEALAEEALIEQGQCNWTNIQLVREAGFPVYAGEKDSFGWLTGCIRTKKGILVYG